MHIQINHEIRPRRIADMMITAIEGNHMTRSWCEGIYLSSHGGGENYVHSTEPNTVWYDDAKLYEDGSGLVLTVVEHNDSDDPEDWKKHEVTLADLENGFKLMADPANKYAHHWTDFLNENEDIITADVWLQFAVLKEVVYG